MSNFDWILANTGLGRWLWTAPLVGIALGVALATVICP